MGSWSDYGPHFPRKCCKNLIFYWVWEPARVQNPDGPDEADEPDEPDEAEMRHNRQFRP